MSAERGLRPPGRCGRRHGREQVVVDDGGEALELLADLGADRLQQRLVAALLGFEELLEHERHAAASELADGLDVAPRREIRAR